MALESWDNTREFNHPDMHREDPATIGQDVENALNSALNGVEAWVRQNPYAAIAGISAVGALVAIAIARRTQPATLDKRLARELSRHTEDVSRLLRRNANALVNSDTGRAIETLVERVVGAFGRGAQAASKAASEISNSN